MKLLYFTIFITILFINPAPFLAQDDIFSEFKTTKAEGKPPAIFTTSFDDKVVEGIENAKAVDKESRDDYAKYTSYALNSLLHSGLVLYGDPMTKYVEKVAANLLKNEPRLRRDLEFYVMKTNTTNALCTEPGVIFITTGLLSQIENEAQLAYVIAHEIVHYQEKHLQKSFSKLKERELDPKSSYEELVKQSKDHEFEADANALELYHAAGYSDKEVKTVFDVLMYSYLTFDEIEIDSSFFGNPNIYIPLSYFPEEANPILALENYDDSKSSHPNIRKRKEAITSEIKKYKDWGSHKNFIELDEFNNVQAIARFESVRENLLIAEYLKALYEIYILEKQFPNNEYLQTSKALAWALMNQSSLSGGKSTLTENVDKKEGSISVLYGFIKTLDQNEMALLSLRQIEDVYKKFPASERLKEIRNEGIAGLTKLRNLNIKKLEKVSYKVALSNYKNHLNDTIKKIDSIDQENETKYDRIRRLREEQNYSKFEAEFIDEDFSIFLLYDLVNTIEFNEIYQEEKRKTVINRSNRYDRRRKVGSDFTIEGDILFITPKFEALYKGNFDLESTLLFHELFNVGIERFAQEGTFYKRDITEVETFTTEKYNEIALINSYITQTINIKNSDFNTLWIDHDEMTILMNAYNDPHLLLVSGDYYYNKFIDKSITGEAKYVQISTGNIYSSRAYESRYKLNKMSIEGFAHLIFTKFE